MHWGETYDTPPAWIALVRQQVSSMRFGVIQIVVHEGQVVQIERTEKVRLPAKATRNCDASAPALAEG